uniref:Phosphoribulokinase/uridine kinase domain-containing protein n=1 Tax=Wuchereria bancrofti TaxID=6293 RepID=A0AAF5Q5B0_WUCBA
MGIVHDFKHFPTMIKVPFIIGVAGGTVPGKVILFYIYILKNDAHLTISQDSFYRSLSDEEIRKANRGKFNFDHPDAIEFMLMISILHKMKEDESVIVPKYDFCTNSRSKDSDVIESADVIIVEGILIVGKNKVDMIFPPFSLRDEYLRRVQRDTQERGRSLSQVLHQYLNLVEPAFEEFWLPTKKYTDIIVPRVLIIMLLSI